MIEPSPKTHAEEVFLGMDAEITELSNQLPGDTMDIISRTADKLAPYGGYTNAGLAAADISSIDLEVYKGLAGVHEHALEIERLAQRGEALLVDRGLVTRHPKLQAKLASLPHDLEAPANDDFLEEVWALAEVFTAEETELKRITDTYEFDEAGYARFEDVTLGELDLVSQYAAAFIDGFGDKPRLAEGLDIIGTPDNWGTLRIKKEDIPEFIRRIKAYKETQRAKLLGNLPS